ncbi:protein of unknown function [Streptomyces murinus]
MAERFPSARRRPTGRLAGTPDGSAGRFGSRFGSGCDSCPAPPRRRIRSCSRSARRSARRRARRSRRSARAVLLGSETTPYRWFHTWRVTQTSTTAQVATTVLTTLLITIGKAGQDSAMVQERHHRLYQRDRDDDQRPHRRRPHRIGQRMPPRGLLDPQRPVLALYPVPLRSALHRVTPPHRPRTPRPEAPTPQ